MPGSGYPKEDMDRGGGGVEAQKSHRWVWVRVSFTSAVEDSLLSPSLRRLGVQHG